jgi:CheY-like chemotaxis protein
MMETGTFSKQLRIMHIEDDAIEAMNLVRIFRKLGVGHDLHFCSNGEEAMQTLQASTTIPPDLILLLLDLHMPLMDGVEFLQALRSDPKLKVISVYVLTSSDLPQDHENASRYGVERYLVKPFTPEKYKETILELLQLWEKTDFSA